MEDPDNEIKQVKKEIKEKGREELQSFANNIPEKEVNDG